MPSDIPGRHIVPVTAGRFRAKYAGSPFDYVYVDLQNALFAKNEFSDWYQCGLRAFAEERATRSEEEILYELLRNGGSPASAFAFQILLSGDLDLVPIESMVLVEARVFRGDYSVLEIGGDLIERNEMVAFAIWGVVNPGLHAALDVHCGCRRVDPPGRNKDQRGDRPKKNQGDDKPLNSGAEGDRPKRRIGGGVGYWRHVSG